MSHSRYALSLAALSIFGCESEAPKTAEEKFLDEFPDGTYTCEVVNATASNGPYTLNCDKSGHTVVVNFPNGGHISGGLVGATKGVLEFAADDSRNNEWHITISR